ncbi:hypothetical protein [Roseobacter sp. OBYS 0001]|uniref:hypothetical protein n=1 Tax=Roseobacter sp. OBYS 0001 TaxID=882651 RepID=UPI001BBB98D7|nr:hypothetical protein [Roseobacter sp. OBYS 0001]GIT88332.1 hypothetical protein ROBYS_33480 [Roseobacter sp. OBYS 0001]
MSLAEIKALVESLKLLFSSLPKEREQLVRTYGNTDYRLLARALEFLYFEESGTLGLLRAYGNGEPLPDDAQQRLNSFFFDEMDVRLELSKLANRFSDKENYSKRQRRQLENSYDLKKNVRNRVKAIGSELLETDPKYRKDHSKKDVWELVESIDELNETIVELEDSLRIIRKQ